MIYGTRLIPGSAFRGSGGFAGDEEETLGLGIAFESSEVGTTDDGLARLHFDFGQRETGFEFVVQESVLSRFGESDS